jgi:hypothetical protein
MVKYLIFCVFIAVGYIVYTTFPVEHGPGITAKEPPKIERLRWQKPFTYKGATLTPKKVLHAEVRIIKRKRYFFDSFSKYSPIDALVGWNAMSDERNLNFIFYTLDDRKYELDLTRPPLKLPKIYAQTALWHLVPSTETLDNKLKSLRDGHIIQLSGLLVDIKNDESFNYTTGIKQSEGKNQRDFAIWVEDLNIR